MSRVDDRVRHHNMNHDANPIDIVTLRREPCPVGNQLILCGDLHDDERVARRQLHHWQRLGVTGIVDCRIEWSDERFVADHAPDLTYIHAGTHDNGEAQPDAWFDAGVSGARAILDADPNAKVMVHCHMGINRGPSMGLAVLLDQGWDTIAALDAIRHKRPIAEIAYATDAVRWHLTTVGAEPESIAAAHTRVADWFDEHNIRIGRVPGQTRTSP